MHGLEPKAKNCMARVVKVWIHATESAFKALPPLEALIENNSDAGAEFIRMDVDLGPASRVLNMRGRVPEDVS